MQMEIKQMLGLLMAQGEPGGYSVRVKELEPMSKEETPSPSRGESVVKVLKERTERETLRDLRPSGCGPSSHMYVKPQSLLRDFFLVSFLEISLSLSSALLPISFLGDRR